MCCFSPPLVLLIRIIKLSKLYGLFGDRDPDIYMQNKLTVSNENSMYSQQAVLPIERSKGSQVLRCFEMFYTHLYPLSKPNDAYLHVHVLRQSTCIVSISGVSWPSGLVHWTQVLVLSECGFESRPGRSQRLCP